MAGVERECRARIGMVNYINTAPLYEVWQQTVQRPQWRITEAVPSILNQMLFQHELDLGFVSSQEYAAHPHLYKILSDLSISATGPVGSVFLFSRIDPAELSGKLVYLTSQSQTSASLVKIILEEFYRVQPRYVTTEIIADFCAVEDQVSAVLAIGDDALRLTRAGCYSVRLDLSEVWQQHTGLPFVFAVWAVRREFLHKDPDSVTEIHRELLRCIDEGRKNLLPICEIVAPRIPMSTRACYDYLCAMEYDLGPQKKKALEEFFLFLIQRGEAPTEALPLEIK
jgi:chorismate dehydratase